jgi:hypothetical protein
MPTQGGMGMAAVMMGMQMAQEDFAKVLWAETLYSTAKSTVNLLGR